jgi:hypothetical protein
VPGFNFQTYAEEIRSQVTLSGVELASTPFISDTELTLRLNRALNAIETKYLLNRARQTAYHFSLGEDIVADNPYYLAPGRRLGQNVEAVGIKNSEGKIRWLKRQDEGDVDEFLPNDPSVDVDGCGPRYWMFRRGFPKQITLRPTPRENLSKALIFRYVRLPDQLWRIFHSQPNDVVCDTQQGVARITARMGTVVKHATVPVVTSGQDPFPNGFITQPTITAGVSALSTSQKWTLTRNAFDTGWVILTDVTGLVTAAFDDVLFTITLGGVTVSFTVFNGMIPWVATDKIEFFITGAPVIENVFLNDEIGVIETTNYDGSIPTGPQAARFWSGINNVFPLFYDDQFNFILDEPWQPPTRRGLNFVCAQVPDHELRCPGGLEMTPAWWALAEFWQVTSPQMSAVMMAKVKMKFDEYVPHEPEARGWSAGMASRVGGFRT